MGELTDEDEDPKANKIQNPERIKITQKDRVGNGEADAACCIKQTLHVDRSSRKHKSHYNQRGATK